MKKPGQLSTPPIKWYQLLKFQIPLAILILFTLLTSAIRFTLTSVEARTHDYAILNLAGQLRVISNNIVTQSQQYKANAPRDYTSYNRDLKLYARTLQHQVAQYDDIIQSFKKREFRPALTGLDSALSCNWDQQSISQLDLTAFEWDSFKAGLARSLGDDENEPRLEYAASYILTKARSLTDTTDQLTKEFRLMMQRKLDDLITTIKTLLLLSTIVAISILALFYFRLLNPLRQSLAGIDQISNGNLQHQIVTRAQNELSTLNQSINNMASSLNAVLNLTSHVSSASTMDETLQIVFEEFAEISPINWAGIFSVNASRTQIKLDRMFSDFDSKLTENQTFAFEDSLMSEIIEQANVVIINDTDIIKQQHPNSAIALLNREDNLKSALLLPLITSFKDDNIIVFASRHTDAYEPAKTDLLNFIGQQLTTSFEKNVVMENLVISAVEGLAKLAESRDPETGDHLLRMSIYSAIIAQQLKDNSAYSEQVNNQYIRDMLRFSPMHDIGKVGIEDSILLKPGKLDDNERANMQQHPVIGGNVLRRCEQQMNQVGYSIFKLGIEIADSHHEKFDGSGYPQQLSGTDIPLSARIVAVADVFDALTSKRPYKEAWPVEQAITLLDQQTGKHFDPVIIQAFHAARAEIMQVYEKYKHI
ncbi:MAG: HD domain-containing protein [Gammaproteobacteria bacterium]|nr:HD domain-containing protein [Gammaproteobacteria bacterium]